VSLPLLAGYFAVLLAFALAQSRKGREKEGYFLAHRKLSFGLVFATYLATSIGSSSTLVQASLIAAYGWRGLALLAGGACGLVLFGLVLAGRVRRTGAFSLAHILGMTYGPWVQKTAAVLVVVAEVLWLALILRALITLALFSSLTLVLMAAAFIAALAIGGQWGLAWMDAAQALIIFAGFAVLLFVASPVSHLPSPGPMPVSLILTLFIATLLPHLAGSDIWGKALSARDEAAASRAAVAAGAGKVLWALLLLLVVMRFALPAAGDKTLPALFGMLPPWAAALPLLSLLSALFSAGNSVLLTAATTLQNDLWPALKARRLLTLGLGAAGAALAWTAPSLLALFTKSYGFFAVAVSLPALLSFLPRRPRPGWVMAGMIGGGGLALWIPLLPALGLAVGFHALGILINRAPAAPI